MPNSFGQGVFLTGQNWFVKCNSARLDAGLAILAAAPTTLSQGDTPTIGTIIADTSAQTVSIAFTNTEGWAVALGALYVQQGQTIPPSHDYFGGPYRRLGVVLGNATPPTSPVVFSAVFPVSTGNYVPLQIRALYPDGRQSGQLTFRQIAVP
jgi:hypothetical protein